MSLSEQQIECFRRDGYCAPLPVLPSSEAEALRRALEQAERDHPRHIHAEHRNNAHIAFPFLADLALDPRIVDCAAALIGEDITLWSSVLFIKEPDSSAFVSWHQDATYMALEPDNFVTAWVALTPSTEETGCVAVIPGTHLGGAAAHRDTFDADNILTRGQRIDAVDESLARNLVLQPGEMSLHHPWLVHGSRPNRSRQRRIGIAFQAYLGADVRPTRGEHHVMHVRGAPVPAPFIGVPRPRADCEANAVAARAAANQAFSDVLYDGAVIRRRL